VRSALILVANDFRRERRALLTLATALFALQVLAVWVARTLDAGDTYTKLAALAPDFARRAAGFDLAVVLSFTGGVGIGYFHPVVTAALVAAAMAAAKGPIADLDGGTAALFLARPVPRPALVVRSLVGLAILAAVLPAAMLAGTTAGLVLVGRFVSTPLAPFARLALNDAALVLSLGAVFTLLAAISSRARGYTQAALAFALVSYLADYLARVWAPLRPLGPLALFHYLEPARILAGAAMLSNLAVLAGITVTAGTAALVVFERRDL
jgi:ABC-type transport system involved in multi-copper enzyme maturation permease subunit